MQQHTWMVPTLECRVHWLKIGNVPGFPYPVVINSSHATPAMCQCLWPLVNPLVQECTCSPLTFLQLRLQTHNRGKLNSWFRLHGFSWHPPRDAKIVICMADARCLSYLCFTVHTGTNQKAQQSCRGGTR